MENGGGINDLSNYQELDAMVQQFDSLVDIFWWFFFIKTSIFGIPKFRDHQF